MKRKLEAFKKSEKVSDALTTQAMTLQRLGLAATASKDADLSPKRQVRKTLFTENEFGRNPYNPQNWKTMLNEQRRIECELKQQSFDPAFSDSDGEGSDKKVNARNFDCQKATAKTPINSPLKITVGGK